MKGFKGTKGEWVRVKLEKTSTYLERNEIHYGKDGECVAEFIANDYDALLISKAPEMLKMLEEIYEDRLFGTDKDFERLNNLIKQATEL